MHKKSFLLSALSIVMLIAMSAGAASAKGSTFANIDVSQRLGNESEEAIAVNPTNPNNVVIFTNIAEGVNGMFLATSFDGGKTWSTHIVGTGTDAFGDTCCDPSLSFDNYGNLFATWLYNTGSVVPIGLSTDGGLTFSLIAQIAEPASLLTTKSSRAERGLFRFVDQPTITTGHNEVWLVFNAGGPIFATGASVTGRGQVGSFFAGEVVPGTNNCTYGDVAIGPQGQVMNVCSLTETGEGGGKVFTNVDPDGLGPAPFGSRVLVAQTHVGGFNHIPPQQGRSVDAESGLAWDRTGGPHNGRVYCLYTVEQPNNSNDTDIFVSYSDDNGATWTTGVRVNDDHTVNSQFNPKISLDQTTGNIAVTWYDSRNDLGQGGPGDTDGVPNTDAQFWGTFSTDGGQTFQPNFQISVGTSNSADAHNAIDYGDYSGLAFFGGMAHPAWSDNSNSTGNNPDGKLHKLDIFTAAVPIGP
jgi:hypothetical protein